MKKKLKEPGLEPRVSTLHLNVLHQPLNYVDGTLLDHLFFIVRKNRISGYISRVRKKVVLKLKI